ncbi:MAG: tape measure protein [Alphaproteobacteria bacterium]
MSLRTHFTLTADGRGVVTAARQSRQALGGLGTATDSAGAAATRANAQTETYRQGMDRARSTMLRLTAAAGGLITAFTAKEIIQAGLAMDGVESSMVGAAGSATLAATETKFLREESERLGIVFDQNVTSYAKMIAAGKAAKMEGRDIRDVFSAIAETGVVFDLSSENMTGALRAIEQMMSKGKVTAEELKLQLGDRLPGVMPIAAKAIGATTEEFYKMLEQGEILSNDFLPKFAAQLREEFGDGLELKLSSARAEFNRMANDLFALQVGVARGGFLDGLIDSSKTLRETLGDDGFQQDVTDLFNAIGKGSGLAATLLATAAQNADLVAAGVAGIIGLKFAAWLTASGAALSHKTLAAQASIAANIRLTQSDLAAARAAEVKAGADVFALRIAKARTTGGTVPQTIANVRLAQAETALAAATVRSSAAQTAAAAAGSRLALVKRGLGAATMLMGGPLGIAVLGIVGLVYAYKQLQSAQEITIGDSEDERDILAELTTARDGLIDVTRDNANVKLQEAEAIHATATALREEKMALAENMTARQTAEAARLKDFIANNTVRKHDGAPRAERVDVNAAEIAAFNLDDIKGFKGDASGGSFSFQRMSEVLKALQPDLDQANERLDQTSGLISEIRKRIEEWNTADNQRSETEISNARGALEMLRSRMALQTDMAGLSERDAAIEKLAQSLFETAAKAKIDLTLEQARVEAATHIEARTRFEAERQWNTLQTDLEERLRAARETPEETSLRTETETLYQAARAAGNDISREEIRLRLTNINAIEDETEAREKSDKARAEAFEYYEDWLEARREELELAKLTNRERDIERLTYDKINLARKAGIEIAEDDARTWAENYVARREQQEREREYVTSLPELYRKAADDINDTWNSMWTDIYNGNLDSAKNFGEQLIDMLKDLAKKAAAIMIIRPILDGSGLTDILGIGSGGSSLLGTAAGAASGGSSGLLGGLLGGAASGGNSGLLGGLLGSANGVLAGLPGVGGLLSGASGAITAGLGALPGIGGALAGIAGALGPVGLIAGAVFGLTTLLKKSPRLESHFGVSGGDVAITSSSTRNIDGGTTDSIAAQINEILDRLDVTLSGPLGFEVLYKPKANHLGVTFDGRGTQVFQADQIEEAVTYTVAEILKSGVADGIDAGLQAAIRRAGTITDSAQLDALISEYTSAQSIGQSIRDAIARRENPEQFEIDNLEAVQAARRAEIESYRQLGYVSDDVIEQLGRLETLEMDELLAQFGESVSAAGDALDNAAEAARARISEWLALQGVSNDNAPLSIAERRANAQTQYQAQYLLAQNGDEEALDTITDYADRLIDLDREATSSAAQRAALYAQIMSQLGTLTQPSVKPNPLDVVIQKMDGLAGALSDVISGVGDIPPGLEGVASALGLDIGQLRDWLRSDIQTMNAQVTAGLTENWTQLSSGLSGLHPLLTGVSNTNNIGFTNVSGALTSLTTSNSGGLTGLSDSLITRLAGLEAVLSGNLTDLIPVLDLNADGIDALALSNLGAITLLNTNFIGRLSDLEDVLSGNLTDILGPLAVQNDALSDLADLNGGGFSSLQTAFQTDLAAGNDNVVQALNDNITALQLEIVGLRGDTVGVSTAVAFKGDQQLAALGLIIDVNEDQVRLLEQGGGTNPPPDSSEIP